MLTTLSRRALLALAAALAPRFARAREPLRYLALGDSFTIGAGSSEAFPARLRALLNKAGVETRLWNVAVNGSSTQELIDERVATAAPVSATLP